MKEKKIKVIAFGTFDYFHAGHENYLKQALALGDELVVVVARDETVKRIKGEKPDHSQRKRLKVIKSLPFVTKAVIGNREDKFKVIKQFKPDIIALGYDQFVFTYQLNKILIQNKMNTKIVRLKPFKPEINKSSIIKKQQQTCQVAEPIKA